MLLQALTTGWYPLAEDESVQLGHFLGVLRHLGRLLVRHRDADLHRARLCQRVKQPYFIPHLPSSPQWTLEGLSVTDRFRLLLLLAWWLEDWPDQFITVCLELPIWPRDLLRHMASPPLWYEQTVEKVTWSEAFQRALQEYNNEWNVP